MSSWDAKDIRQAVEDGELLALAHAGYMDYDDADYISSFVQNYEPIDPDDPKRATETERYRKLVTRAATREVNRAVAAGNTGRMAYGAGHQDDRIDATGYQRLLDRLERPSEQFVLRGAKGSGKSTKAVDLTKRLHRRLDGQLKVWTNIAGVEHEDVEFGETVSSMLEFARKDGERLVLLDEASTSINAYSGKGYEVEETFGQAINALRKGEGGSVRLIAIGHQNNKDIHPIIRKQTDVVMRADGKERDIDKATLYEGWEAYQQGDEWFRISGLQDVTDEKWSFDSNYFAVFRFDLNAPDKQIRRGRLVDDWREYQDTDTPRQSKTDDSSVENERCRGEKDDGSRCGIADQSRIGPHGYCKYHRDQYGPEDDSDKGRSSDSDEPEGTPESEESGGSSRDLIHK